MGAIEDGSGERVVLASFAAGGPPEPLRAVRATTLALHEDAAAGHRRFLLTELSLPADAVAGCLRALPGCLSADVYLSRAEPPEDRGGAWAALEARCPAAGVVVYWLSPALARLGLGERTG